MKQDGNFQTDYCLRSQCLVISGCVIPLSQSTALAVNLLSSLHGTGNGVCLLGQLSSKSYVHTTFPISGGLYGIMP
eukprot:238092-Amphidinium_carterae.1